MYLVANMVAAEQFQELKRRYDLRMEQYEEKLNILQVIMQKYMGDKLKL